MFLSLYRFEGDPAALQAAHRRLLATIDPSTLQLHQALPRSDGLHVYDSCPSLAVAEAFNTSPNFAQLLSAAGLPWPGIERLGAIAGAVLKGRRVD